MDETRTGGTPEATGNPGETTAPGPTGDLDVDSSLELIIGTFLDKASSGAAFKEVKEAEREEGILLVDAAVVSRDKGNKLHVSDEQDFSGGAGALIGGGIGAIIGMVAGPLGLVVGSAAGAAIGAASAARSDTGMSDDGLEEFAEALRPGASMVIVAVAHFWTTPIQDILKRAGGEVKTITLTDEIARHLHINRKKS